MIRVFFDETEINSNYIQGLRQSVKPYNQNFSIGNTICRQFSLDVRNEGVNSIPNKVYLYDDEEIYATLLVDDYTNESENYYSFSLTDVMVRFNTDLEYTTVQTVLQILNNICSNHNINLATQSFYMSDFVIDWTDELSERDLISYVAEVNGGYAYINNEGNLVIAEYSKVPSSSLDINTCSSYKVGSKHLIDRVYVELATATQYYPETTNNDTLYLNPENILFTDSGNYTIEDTLKHIHSIVDGFTFYNISIERCEIDKNVKVGQLIGVGGWGNLLTSNEDYIQTSDGDRILVTDGLNIPFLCTIDWNYNTQWLGGYETDLECALQEETQIITSREYARRVNIKVDRVTGEILQEVSDLDASVTASLSLKVDKDDNDQIISMINASADNIILNTKSLIFGVYPSGQYIEVKNYYSSSIATGILFEGNGEIQFKSQGKFYVDNYDSNGIAQNGLEIGGANTNNHYITLLNSFNSYPSNAIYMNSYSYNTNNVFNIQNFGYQNNYIANNLSLNSNSSSNYTQLANRNESGDILNSIELIYSKTTGSATLGLYNWKKTSSSTSTSNGAISINDNGIYIIPGTGNSIIMDGHKITFSNGYVMYT